MNSDSLIAQLDDFRTLLPALIAAFDEESARWKPNGAWSALEIVAHLEAEEREDFRPRLKSTLDDPTRPWAAIDPEGVVVERRFNESDLTQVARSFERERVESVRWLRSLERPDWSATYEHAVIGRLAAGDLLSSWAAHDALHARQLVQRRFQVTDRDAGDFSTRYAGLWPTG